MAKIFKGENGLYGVEDGGVIYEADFPEITAIRLAELESQKRPPKDWEATREILEREGLPLSATERIKS